jgi:hypothetical protein
MVGSFMTILCNNVKVTLSPDSFRASTGSEQFGIIFSHVISYIILYFSFREFSEYLVNKF